KPRPEMIPAGDLWKLPEDHLDIIDTAVTELATGNGGSGVVFTRLRIGEKDQPVVGEMGIERHVEQPALALREDLWHALERLGLLAILAHDAKAPWPRGHEHAPIRKKCQPPGMLKPVGNGLDLDRALLRVDYALCSAGRLRHHRQCRACPWERSEEQAPTRQTGSNCHALVAQ